MKVKVEVKNEMLANSQGQQVMDDDPQLAVSVQGQEPLAASMSAQEPPSEQKQMLGQRLFPLIQGLYPDLAGKITDMLLEMDNSELVNMLEHQESLKKIEEAVASLKVATPTTASGSVIKTGKNFAKSCHFAWIIKVVLDFQDGSVLLSPQLPLDLVPQVSDNKHKLQPLEVPVLHLNHMKGLVASGTRLKLQP